jgi:hypothetical protein
LLRSLRLVILLRRNQQAMRASAGAFLESEALQVRIPRGEAMLYNDG